MVFSKVGPNQTIEWGQIRVSKSSSSGRVTATSDQLAGWVSTDKLGDGGRWRLRWMRANGWTRSKAMGIESFFVCSLLILHYLGKS